MVHGPLSGIIVWIQISTILVTWWNLKSLKFQIVKCKTANSNFFFKIFWAKTYKKKQMFR